MVRSFLSGYASAFDIRGRRFSRQVVTRSHSGIKRDKDALRGDGKTIRSDIRRALIRMAANG